MRKLLTILTVLSFTLGLSSMVAAQDYDAVLKSLKKLDSTIQVIKQSYGRSSERPRQYTDADGMAAKQDLDRNLMYDFALNFERVVADLSDAMSDAKQAEASRPKNPAGVGHGKIVFSGYLHQQYYDKAGSAEKSTFDSKRVRLGVKGSLNEYASVNFLGEFADSPTLLDGALTISPNKNWSLTIGQYRPPFGTEFLKSATVWPFVNASKAKGLGPDRDVGTHIQFQNPLGESADVKLMAGVFNGAGVNTSDANTDKNFVARAELSFAKKLMVAPSVYVGKTNDTGTARQDITSFGGSATWEWQNETLEVEYIHSKVGDVNKAGWYVWGGHSFQTHSRFLPEIQLVARYEQLDNNLDVDDDATNRITLGTNLFIDKKYTKLQVNYQINGEQGDDVDNNEFLVNFQVAF